MPDPERWLIVIEPEPGHPMEAVPFQARVRLWLKRGLRVYGIKAHDVKTAVNNTATDRKGDSKCREASTPTAAKT
jgi:hypothetical protein